VDNDPIFAPLQFRNLTIKNRLLRSSVSGRFDHYDGTGTDARINWELKFARGGVGAIVSSWTAIDLRGRIVPNYAGIERDERIPFWRELGKRVHEHDCKFIVQLAHAGRQRDVRGFEIPKGLSSTNKPDSLHGFECERMSVAQIRQTVQSFAAAARRVREAGLDGVELHGANGYLFTQFLSSALNDRRDEFGGSLENRARLLLETVREVRRAVGPDFHLQVKISATEYANAVFPWSDPGNTIDDSVRVCRWLEEAGADAIHVSSGSTFPHPKNPPGEYPVREIVKTYNVMLSSGKHTLRNYLAFRLWPINRIFERSLNRQAIPLDEVEGCNLPDARAVKQAVGVPVIVTGGFQTASRIRAALAAGDCDAVAIGRPLIANSDLPHLLAQGHDRPPNPCTYCNKCLFNVLAYPLGCYDERRFSSRQEMLREIMSVYQPSAFSEP
jgi:2,4-dienoyl-CoA reductase (NADPH2)